MRRRDVRILSFDGVIGILPKPCLPKPVLLDRHARNLGLARQLDATPHRLFDWLNSGGPVWFNPGGDF
jgi:hypothetical protein